MEVSTWSERKTENCYRPSIDVDGTAFLVAANADRAVSSGKSPPVHWAPLGVFTLDIRWAYIKGVVCCSSK